MMLDAGGRKLEERKKGRKEERKKGR